MPHRFLAGVDLGATNVRVAIASMDGEIEARRSMPFPGGAPEDALARIRRTIDDLSRGGRVGAQAAAIGVALPGAVDPRRGTVASVANLPGWDDVPLAALLGGEGRVPVAMDNDANAAAIGEVWLGAAKGMRDFVFIALGTGIGAGVFVDGALRHGAHFLAGEVAFSPMTREQLLAPNWDNCLEATVGGRAHAAKARELLGERANAQALFEAAREGSDPARAWVSQAQEHLAMLVADIAALLDPEAVIFGGGVAMAQGEALLAPVREMALRCTPAKPRIVLSALGEDAQLFGALKLAADAIA